MVRKTINDENKNLILTLPDHGPDGLLKPQDHRRGMKHELNANAVTIAV